jgi:hypothetical protein
MAKYVMLIAALFLTASHVFAQRKNQIEFYAGAAFPLGPELFKEYTKVGLSGNAQYVLFTSPRLGITFNLGYERFSTNNAKFVDGYSSAYTGQKASFWASQIWITSAGPVRINPSADISASLIRFGAGLRPYLTAPEASTQVFLLGQMSFNIINNNFNATELPYSYDANINFLRWGSFDDQTWESLVGENDERVLGFGLGGGIEIPAAASFNIVLQGLFNFILTKSENKLLQKENQTTTFVGATAGIVF